MYNLEYLPIARQDLVGIVRYISRELLNPAAAERLTDDLMEAAEGIRRFPYAHPAVVPIRPLSHEYRKLRVKNYLLFYWVDERTHRVTVARVLYARRDYEKLL